MVCFSWSGWDNFLDSDEQPALLLHYISIIEPCQ